MYTLQPFVQFQLLRALDVPPWSTHLNQWLLVFLDEQDSLELVLTPLLLLVGVFMPVYVFPVDRQTMTAQVRSTGLPCKSLVLGMALRRRSQRRYRRRIRGTRGLPLRSDAVALGSEAQIRRGIAGDVRGAGVSSSASGPSGKPRHALRRTRKHVGGGAPDVGRQRRSARHRHALLAIFALNRASVGRRTVIFVANNFPHDVLCVHKEHNLPVSVILRHLGTSTRLNISSGVTVMLCCHLSAVPKKRFDALKALERL